MHHAGKYLRLAMHGRLFRNLHHLNCFLNRHFTAVNFLKELIGCFFDLFSVAVGGCHLWDQVTELFVHTGDLDLGF